MSRRKKSIEIIQYLTLLFGLSVAAILFQKTIESIDRFFIIVIVSILYVIWGYWHHGHMERLDKLVLLEYSLVALIMVLLAALGLGVVRFL